MRKVIFLVSGIGLRPDLKLVRYWRNVPEIIESLGYDVVVVDVDAFGTIESNLEIICETVSHYLSSNTEMKVECHIWGHSKGALEVLNLVTKDSLRKKISSFVLLNPPIQGAVMAKRLLNSYSIFRKAFVWCANTIGSLMGDRAPDLENALMGLAKDYRYLLTKQIDNIHIFQSNHAFNELPFVWKPAAIMAYGRSRTGDGIVEYQDLKGLNINLIEVNSIEINRIVHSSVAGIPYFSGLNPTEFRNLWTELLNKCIHN